MSPDKSKKVADLQAAIAAIKKSYGAGSIMQLGSAAAVNNIEAVSSGSLSLDCALGVGGLPKGRIVEVFGPEASGKTTLTLHAIANVQKNNGQAAFIDAEHALDPAYAKALGVRLDDLLVSQPDSGEQALSICETLARSHAVDIIVVDSVAALVPQAELVGEMGAPTMGSQARLLSQALRKVTGLLHKANCLCMFTNQLREKVGIMFGSPETTPGGKALKFYASVRLDVRRKDCIKDSQGRIVGNHVKVKVVKNKVAAPFMETEFDILFGYGINKEADVLETAVATGLVEKKGTWFQYQGKLLGRGREATCQALGDTPELMQSLVTDIRRKRLKTVTPLDASEPPEMTDTALLQEEKREQREIVQTGLLRGVLHQNENGLEFRGIPLGETEQAVLQVLSEKADLRQQITDAIQIENPKKSPELAPNPQTELAMPMS